VGTTDDVSRRDFFKRAGAAAGAAGLPALTAVEALAQAAPSPASLPDPPASPFPTLNRRTLGWLRFLWEKSATLDDWSSNGVPHPWWDRYSVPVVLSYGRFDLSYSAYGLLMMADQTPAWREVYTRVVDEMAKRYPTYWGAIDWLTQIGDDPKRANYPPGVMATLPPNLRGNYNRFGWTGNGIEPWGLQKDPIGADGYLFYRGWFHLLLATYKYVSGSDKWAAPFKVTGYGDEQFDWDHHRLAARLEEQYRQRPEGPHCENTKIWFYCNSAAALGMYLYDRVYGRQTHRAAQNFLEYARKNYVGVSADGRLEWVTNYYDPRVDFKLNGPPIGGLFTAFMLAPQDRDFATFLYDAAVNAAGYRGPNSQVRANSEMLLLARELGDSVVADKLHAAAERESDPRFFGARNEMFGWWFRLNEGYPRGQASATLMVSEIGKPGDWLRVFQVPHLDKFTAPTVEGVDFPSVGLYQAWNDVDSGTLNVGTYAAAPDKRGTPTSFRVTNLPDARAARISVDGQPFTRFEATGPDSIRVDTTIDVRQFRIVTGYRGVGRRAAERPQDRRNLVDVVETRSAKHEHAPAARGAGLTMAAATSTGCPCC
jgi:hypothetical protein